MVVREHMECEVCGCITVLRVQIGYRESHPIRYVCGNCGISMKGKVSIDSDAFNIDVFVDNCKKTTMENDPQYYIEVSPELLTEKLREVDTGSERDMTTPFFKNMDILGNMEFIERSGHLTAFHEFKTDEWPKIRRIIELYLNKNTKYINKEIHSILPVKQFPCNSSLEQHRGVHTLYIHSINAVNDEKFFSQTCRFLERENLAILKKLPNEYQTMISELETNDYFLDMEKKILKLTCDFFDIFDYIHPVVLVSLADKLDTKRIVKSGLSTCDFEDIKQFYIDAYEFLCESMLLPTLLNNLKYRENTDIFNESMNISTVDQYKKMSKGKRIEFCDKEEVYYRLYKSNLDNKVRNAIGHNSYNFDGKTQLIDFLDTKKPVNDKSHFLIEFADMCLGMFHDIVTIQELLYKTRKMYFISRGDKSVHPNTFGRIKRKKIGRNEPCVCGSGEKFKRCCGK